MKIITPFEASELIRKDGGVALIDVRTPAEVAEVSVPGAILIPLDQLASRLHELAGYSTLLFMCRSGGRSASAAALAESAKLPGVMNVMGGIIGWISAGLPVARGGSERGISGFANKKVLMSGGIVLGGIFLALLIVLGRGGVSSTLLHVPPAQFAERIQEPGILLLDVRTPDEYAGGHIAGATNIDFYDPNFQEKISTLDKTATYEVYCHTGNRSGKTLSLMRSLGFAHVQDMSGGILSWLREGRPVVK